MVIIETFQYANNCWNLIFIPDWQVGVLCVVQCNRSAQNKIWVLTEATPERVAFPFSSLPFLSRFFSFVQCWHRAATYLVLDTWYSTCHTWFFSTLHQDKAVDNAHQHVLKSACTRFCSYMPAQHPVQVGLCVRLRQWSSFAICPANKDSPVTKLESR